MEDARHETRGRPRKDPSERRSEIITIKTAPPAKKHVRLEAKRCDASLARVVRGTAFRIIEQEVGPPPGAESEEGRSFPPLVAETDRQLAKASRRLARLARQLSPSAFESHFEAVPGWLAQKRGEVEAHRRELERLEDRKSPDVGRSEQISLRVCSGVKSWLEDGYERESGVRGLSAWIREKMLLGLTTLSDLRSMEIDLEEWAEQAGEILELPFTEDPRAEARRLAESIEEKVGGEAFRKIGSDL